MHNIHEIYLGIIPIFYLIHVQAVNTHRLSRKFIIQIQSAVYSAGSYKNKINNVAIPGSALYN